jgi:hypothetical protein
MALVGELIEVARTRSSCAPPRLAVDPSSSSTSRPNEDPSSHQIRAPIDIYPAADDPPFAADR